MVSYMKIKICGLRRPEDVEYVNQAMPDYGGFILAQGFRRSVSLEQAWRLRRMLEPEIQAVGVFVNEKPERVIECLEKGLIDIAQLHGDESEEELLYIKAVTAKPVIKTVRALNRCMVEAWLDSAADYLLFDSGAGTGRVFDWQLLADVERDYFLAGGLNPDNLEEAAQRLHPYGADISSGVETDGVKDCEKIAAAVRVVRGFGFE
ncbi:MAG: phosphoribosylanthranilate isomerase [Roseburia sp.]|nr:phosphoribosylanthranilate isomerase [Roseburia sp.]